MFSASGMVDQIMSLAFYIINIGSVQTQDTAFDRECDKIAAAALEAGDRPAKTLAEGKIGHGFQNIVKGVYLVAANGILRHICDKNNDNLESTLRISSAAVIPSTNFI